jgi:hypothetical protein
LRAACRELPACCAAGGGSRRGVPRAPAVTGGGWKWHVFLVVPWAQSRLSLAGAQFTRIGDDTISDGRVRLTADTTQLYTRRLAQRRRLTAAAKVVALFTHSIRRAEIEGVPTLGRVVTDGVSVPPPYRLDEQTAQANQVSELSPTPRRRGRVLPGWLHSPTETSRRRSDSPPSGYETRRQPIINGCAYRGGVSCQLVQKRDRWAAARCRGRTRKSLYSRSV